MQRRRCEDRQKERETEKKRGEKGGAFVFYLFMKYFSIYFLFFTSMSYVKLLVSPCNFSFHPIQNSCCEKNGKEKNRMGITPWHRIGRGDHKG